MSDRARAHLSELAKDKGRWKVPRGRAPGPKVYSPDGSKLKADDLDTLSRFDRAKLEVRVLGPEHPAYQGASSVAFGVFAKEPIASGEVVCHYTGFVEHCGDENENTILNLYYMDFGGTKLAVSANPLDADTVASFINDARNTKQPVNAVPCHFMVRHHDRDERPLQPLIVFKSTRAIRTGEEVLMDYGPVYWKHRLQMKEAISLRMLEIRAGFPRQTDSPSDFLCTIGNTAAATKRRRMEEEFELELAARRKRFEEEMVANFEAELSKRVEERLAARKQDELDKKRHWLKEIDVVMEITAKELARYDVEEEESTDVRDCLDDYCEVVADIEDSVSMEYSVIKGLKEMCATTLASMLPTLCRWHRQLQTVAPLRSKNRRILRKRLDSLRPVFSEEQLQMYEAAKSRHNLSANEEETALAALILSVVHDTFA